ncbi:MAG TPA: DUF5915 domain-containing protein, partial [Actinomycetota bacterium]|nr:DUF5915 domain-containing protein [Actinomycetota bacterium]
FMSVTLVGKAPYRRVLGYERVTDETGRAMHKSWGNAIWFDDAIETIGADVMRWMYASAEPARNFGFGYTPANDVKRKLLTFWNTYKFFIEYALIDGYEPSWDLATQGPDLETCRPLDRWALARTQSLVHECRTAYEEFDSPRVARTVERYFDDLSNWYLRLSRARFWKSEDDADKKSAYDTLWYCLVQATRCIAPIMPFLSDHVWQNLVRAACADAPDSVHLAEFAAVHEELSDAPLIREMESVRAVVELGRAARAEANIKIRQPLQAVVVATSSDADRARLNEHRELIATELNVKDVRFTSSAEDFAQVEIVPNFRVLGPKYGKDVGAIQALLKQGRFELTDGEVKAGEYVLGEGEFDVRTRAREGYAVVDGDGFALALDTDITPELELEARARDLIRAIQDLRKERGLQLTDRIVVHHAADVGDVVAQHADWIKRETLAIEMVASDALEIEKAS